MRLLIKQRVFSWSDTYDVYDEEGNVRYRERSSGMLWYDYKSHQCRCLHLDIRSMSMMRHMLRLE